MIILLMLFLINLLVPSEHAHINARTHTHTEAGLQDFGKN